MATISINLSFDLIEKEVRIDGTMRSVYGIAALHVLPKRSGIGKIVVKFIERWAARKGKYCIVGFCKGPNTGFWKKCGWSVISQSDDDQYIMASKPFKKIKTTNPYERW